jgi:Zn-finger nucleic acid-binding protein
MPVAVMPVAAMPVRATPVAGPADGDAATATGGSTTAGAGAAEVVVVSVCGALFAGGLAPSRSDRIVPRRRRPVADAGGRSHPDRRRGQTGAVNCPNDGETLMMTERRGVELDYCPRCRGVWLDRGELDKLLQAADRDDDDDDRRDEDRGYGRDLYRDPRQHEGKRHRKRSFLSEMFEFGD